MCKNTTFYKTVFQKLGAGNCGDKSKSLELELKKHRNF